MRGFGSSRCFVRKAASILRAFKARKLRKIPSTAIERTPRGCKGYSLIKGSCKLYRDTGKLSAVLGERSCPEPIPTDVLQSIRTSPEEWSFQGACTKDYMYVNTDTYVYTPMHIYIYMYTGHTYAFMCRCTEASDKKCDTLASSAESYTWRCASGKRLGCGAFVRSCSCKYHHL